MPMFNWDDFRTLAKRLAASDDEDSLRSSISRSYYAAYHTAEEFCRDFRVPTPPPAIGAANKKDTQHSRVISALENHPNARIQKSGRLLAELRKWRHRADYQSNLEGDLRDIVRMAIAAADAIIDAFDAFYRGTRVYDAPE